MARKARKATTGKVLRCGEYERARGGFECKFIDVSGKRVSISAPTLEELRARKKEIEASTAAGVIVSNGRKSLNFYFDKWHRQKRGVKPQTLSNYVYMYNTFVRTGIGCKKIDSVKYTDIKGFYCGLLDGKAVSMSTLETLQNVLYQIFAMAARDDCIRINPCDGVMSELKREHGREKKAALTPAEQARLRSVVAGTVWDDFVNIMLGSGMRIGEAAGLTWDDIDYDARVIHIRRTLVYYKDQTKGEMLRIVNTPKTESGNRDIPMTDELWAHFEHLRATGKRCTATIDGVSGFVFATRFGGAIQQGCVNKALKRIIRDANADKDADVLLPSFSCHAMRRTFATNAVRGGVSLPVLMAWMGHKDVSTTISYYIEVQADMSMIESEAVRKQINDICKIHA